MQSPQTVALNGLHHGIMPVHVCRDLCTEAKLKLTNLSTPSNALPLCPMELEPVWLRAELRVPLIHGRNQLPEHQEMLPKVDIFSLVKNAIGMPLTSHMV